MRERFPRIIALVQEQIRHFVKNNKPNLASKLLVEVMEACEKSRLNEALIIAGKVECFESELRQGLLDRQAASEERSKLFLCILAINDSLSPPDYEAN